MINKKRVIRTIQRLIAINSENPPGNEYRISLFVRDYLRKLGLKVKLYEFKKWRPNVLGYLPGNNSRHTILITPHLDTVPAGKNWPVNPFSGKVIKDKIYGLGATDCKGNLACALEAINSMVEENKKPNCNVVFAATADEETGSKFGLIPLLKRGLIKVDSALVLDADNFNIIVAQKGLIHLGVKVEGKRAHGAYPWRGVSAIDIALKIIKDIKKEKFAYKRNAYLHPPTVNIGTIRGGDKVNIVADWCEFEADFRFLPGMSAREILSRVKSIIRKNSKRYKIELIDLQNPYSIKKDAPLVKHLTDSAAAFGIKAEIKGSEGATVITFFQDKNIAAVASGFGCHGCAHSDNEYITINNLYKGSCVLERFLIHYSPR